MKTIFTKVSVVFAFAFLLILFGCGEEEQPEVQEIPQVPAQSEETVTDTVQQDTTVNDLAAETNMADTKTDEMASSIPEIYVVDEGETLASIAYKFYGDSTMWFDIFAANEGNINNWNKIYPGQELEMVEPNDDNGM